MEDTFGSSSSEQESSNYLGCCWKIAANRICKNLLLDDDAPTRAGTYKWRLTVRQIFRSLSRICFPPSDKLSLELATQIKLSWASHAYLLA